jgi:hypothetical protein
VNNVWEITSLIPPIDRGEISKVGNLEHPPIDGAVDEKSKLGSDRCEKNTDKRKLTEGGVHHRESRLREYLVANRHKEINK